MTTEIANPDPRSFQRAVEHQAERLTGGDFSARVTGWLANAPDAIAKAIFEHEAPIIEGEIVDESGSCSGVYCGNVGRLMVDPYDQDVNDGNRLVYLCDDCEREAVADI